MLELSDNSSSALSSNGNMSSSNMNERILKLLLEYNAVGYCNTIFKPTALEIVNCNLLATMLSDYLKKCTEADIIALLTQLPFHAMKENSITSAQVQKSVFEPIKLALTQLSSQTHFKLMVHLAKIIMVMAEQYVELTLEAMTLFTRAPWPSKMITTPTLVMYPWSQLPDPSFIEAAFREMFHLFNNSYSGMTDMDQRNHQNDFVNKYLIPYLGIIQQVYAAEPKLKLANDGLDFPIVKLFRLFVLACASMKKPASTIVDISNLLFNLAYKTGTTDRNNLPWLMKLRTEACEQIQFLCTSIPETITCVINQLYENVAFFMKTQPAVVDSAITMILKFNLKQWVLTAKDIEILERLLLSNVPQVHSAQGTADAAVKIARSIIEVVAWDIQSQQTNFKLLEALLKHSALPNATEWVGKIISGPNGIHITTVSEVAAAEQFLGRIVGKYDEFHLSLSTLIALSVCEKKIRQAQSTTSDLLDVEQDIVLGFDAMNMSTAANKSNARSLAIWRETEQKYTIRNQIALLVETSGFFLPSIIRKYVTCLSFFEVNDIADCLHPISSVLLKHLTKERFMHEINQIMHLEVTDAAYSKTLQLWATVLLSNMQSAPCMKLLDTCIKQEFRRIQPLDPFVEPLKLMNIREPQILHFIVCGYTFLAYASVLAHSVQLPPVASVNPVATPQNPVCNLWFV